MAFGDGFTIVKNECGQIYAIGANNVAQCGIGGSPPEEVTTYTLIPTDRPVVLVSASNTHAGGICDDGSVITWGFGAMGANSHGLIGTMCRTPRAIPASVFASFKATQLSCGAFHSAVLTENGRVFTVGGNSAGALGHGGGMYAFHTRCIPLIYWRHFTDIIHTICRSAAELIHVRASDGS